MGKVSKDDRKVKRGLSLLKDQTQNALARSLYNWENEWDARAQNKNNKPVSFRRTKRRRSGKRREQRDVLVLFAFCALLLVVQSVGLGGLGSVLAFSDRSAGVTARLFKRAPYKVRIATCNC
jgi:hypothetical protein